ncbi:MAG: radical SAM protein [Lachnospiraceae bacterium]|nr:radical SAM protein [Lachnospiraceae bacterium]
MKKEVIKDLERYKKLYTMLTTDAFVSITTRCNASCRHCINGSNVEQFDAQYDDVMSWLEQLKECGSQSIHFVGGEPFFIADKLIDYVKKTNELGMNAGVVTNAFWAKDKDKAIELLEKMPGLHNVVISTDKYHLEYIDAQTVKNAIDACFETGKFPNINMIYVEKEEIIEINDIYKEYLNKIFIQPIKAMPFEHSDSEKLIKVKPFKKPRIVPRYCHIGNIVIGIEGRVDACCQSSRSDDSKYLNYGNMNEMHLKKLMQNFRNKDVASFISRYGPRGVVEKFAQTELIDDLINKEFTGGCEVCCDLLNNPKLLERFKNQINEEYLEAK